MGCLVTVAAAAPVEPSPYSQKSVGALAVWSCVSKRRGQKVTVPEPSHNTAACIATAQRAWLALHDIRNEPPVVSPTGDPSGVEYTAHVAVEVPRVTSTAATPYSAAAVASLPPGYSSSPGCDLRNPVKRPRSADSLAPTACRGHNPGVGRGRAARETATAPLVKSLGPDVPTPVDLPKPEVPSARALAVQFLDTAGMLGLQEAVGNAATSRLVEAGQPALARSPLQRDLPSGEEYDTARRAKQDWVSQGLRGPENFRSSTGLGGFNVSYGPNNQELWVNLKGGIDFEDGIELFLGMFATANQGTAPVQAAAQAINRLPRAQRAAAVAPWQWSGGDKASFIRDFQNAVHDAWNARYEFHCTKHYWEDLGSTVNVEVDIHEGDKGGDDHMKLKTFKIAPNAQAGGVGLVESGTGGSQDNTMTINSTDVTARNDIVLNATAAFTPGQAAMDAANTQILTNFGTTFKSGGGPRCGTCGKEIAGLAGTPIHAKIQGSGDDPQASAQARFTFITGILQPLMNTAPQFEFDGNGDGISLVVGSGAQQVVAAHEAGHMFGLDDEYDQQFGATRPAAGGALADTTLGTSQGLPGPVAENTDSIMSVGAAVKPQHYMTFLEALKHVTGMQEWTLGPAPGVVPPGVDGPQPRENQGAPGIPGTPGTQPQEPATAVA